MRRATAVMGVAMVMFASAASAQDKPNFSGKWTLDAEKTAASNPARQGGGGGGGGGGGRGMGGMGSGPLTLTLDAASLTSVREGPNGAITIVYKLDGTETDVAMGQMTAKAKAKWDGNTIVIEQTVTTPNGARTTTSVYSMEGDYLVISSTRPGRDGGAGVTTKQYYKKG